MWESYGLLGEKQAFDAPLILHPDYVEWLLLAGERKFCGFSSGLQISHSAPMFVGSPFDDQNKVVLAAELKINGEETLVRDHFLPSPKGLIGVFEEFITLLRFWIKVKRCLNT